MEIEEVIGNEFFILCFCFVTAVAAAAADVCLLLMLLLRRFNDGRFCPFANPQNRNHLMMLPQLFPN